MVSGDDFLFVLHQIIIITLCIFLMYFSWRDQRALSYDPFEYTGLKFLFPLLVGIFLGVFGLLILEWGSIGIVLAFAFAFLITFTIFDPKYGVSFFVFLLISRPWEIFKDEMMASMPRDIFILCFISFVGHKILRKQLYFQWNGASAMVFLFALWTFFSIIPSFQIVGALLNYNEIFIKGIIVYFLIVNVIEKKQFIKPIQIALVLGISEKAIMSFYNSFFMGKVADGERLTSVGILENSNDIAAIMILAIPFTISFFKSIQTKILKYLLSALVLVFYGYLIWQSKSRGAVLGLGTLAITMFWLKAKNKKIASLIVVGGLLCSLGAMSLIQRNSEDVEGSTSNRKIYWTAAVNMGLRNPIFGVGYDGYPLNLFTYTNGHVGTEGRFKTAHSTWLLALAETGFVGAFFYVGIWIYAFRASWRMRFKRPEFLLAIISYGTAITFLSHTYMLYPYILIGLTVAAGKFYSEDGEYIDSGVDPKLRLGDT